MSKKKLFEEMEFDNYQYALDVKKDAEERLEKVNGALKLSVVGTIVGIFTALLLYFVWEFMWFFAWQLAIPTIILSIICYMKIGGIKTVLGLTLKLATIGWFLIPIFPIDLILGLLVLVVVLCCLLICPVVLVGVFKIQAKKEFEQADEYLKYFKPVNEEANINEEADT